MFFLSFLWSIADFYGWLSIIGSVVGAVVVYQQYKKAKLKRHYRRQIKVFF
jgi:hypothetical protein